MGVGYNGPGYWRQNETPLGVPFCPVPFCPTVPFYPNIPCSILPPRLRSGKSHYVNYDIARCSIKWCENENKRYIVSNHMQRFYYFICQRTWCQNASTLIYQKGEVTFDAGFFQNTRCSILPPCSVLPRLTIQVQSYENTIPPYIWSRLCQKSYLRHA